MDGQCGRVDKVPLEQMLREVNECVSGKNHKFWSQMTLDDDWNGTVVILVMTYIYEFIDSIIAITILRLHRIDFRLVIFEAKTKCSVETRYVGICQISTKGDKKMGNTHGLKRAGLAYIQSHPQAI
jgi:hypothetical protein